jgi:hypothetical protein
MRGSISRNSKILASAPSNNCRSNPRSFHIAAPPLCRPPFPKPPHRQAGPVNALPHSSRPLSWGRHGGPGLCGLCAARAWPRAAGLCGRALCGLCGPGGCAAPVPVQGWARACAGLCAACAGPGLTVAASAPGSHVLARRHRGRRPRRSPGAVWITT